ncbi:hypothetical protein D3C83_38810 [compost metagenome]
MPDCSWNSWLNCSCSSVACPSHRRAGPMSRSTPLRARTRRKALRLMKLSLPISASALIERPP